MKKLVKNEENRMICGVCAGVADYFEVDATLVRLIFVAASIFTGVITGIIAYAVAAVVMP